MHIHPEMTINYLNAKLSLLSLILDRTMPLFMDKSNSKNCDVSTIDNYGNFMEHFPANMTPYILPDRAYLLYLWRLTGLHRAKSF